MNLDTLNKLVEFIKSIENLAYFASSVTGTDIARKVSITSDELIEALETDETILKSKD